MSTSQFRQTVLLGVMLIVAMTRSVAAQPKVTAEVSPEQIYLGESVRYRVTFQDIEGNVEPKLADSQDFKARLLGKSMGMRSQVIINGKLQSFSESGPSFEFLLVPQRTGTLQVPTATVEWQGNQYSGPELKLQVLSPDDQDIVLLELTSDREYVYPMQPFTVELKVLIKPLPDPFAGREPVSVQQSPPQLLIPWAEDEGLPSGVAAREPTADWLRNYLSSHPRLGGFRINRFQTSGGLGAFPDIDQLLSGGGFPDPDSLFSFFNEDRRAAFRPEPKRRLQADSEQRRVEYWEYTFRRTFIAQEIGNLSFGPVSAKGIFATRADSQGELVGERIYAVANPLAIEVRDAPLAGRPDSYSGAIGRFEIGATMTPTQGKVGDPMTLSLWLQGDGTLQRVTAPDLEKIPDVAQAFKLYEATGETDRDRRTFTYSLRPKTAGITEFPAIPLTYFDSSQEKYVTVTTPPIPLEIAEADPLDEQQIAMTARPARSNEGLQISREGVFANITDLSELRDESVRPMPWLITLGGFAGVFLVLAGGVRQVRKRRDDPVGQRRREASRRARQRVQEAQAELSRHAERAALDRLTSAFAGLVADASGISEVGLTSEEIVTHLRDIGVAKELALRVERLLEQCDAARYSSGAGTLPSLCQEAHQLMEALLTDLRSQKQIG